MQTSFSDPRIQEYMDDGGAKYDKELSLFLAGLAQLSMIVYGTTGPVQRSLINSLNKGIGIHESASLEYETLRRRVVG